MGLVTRWEEYARQYGWGGLVQHLVLRVLRPVWERSSAQLLVMEPPARPAGARVPIRIELLTRDQAAGEGLLTPGWDQRWSRGDLCFGAWREDRLVHHSWVSFGHSYIGELHSSLRMEPGEAYVYDCYTDGSCRGQGIFPAVLAHVAETLFQSGTRRLWIAVEEENRSSAKAILRAGFQPAGELRYRRVGPWAQRAVERTPGAPAFRVE